MERPSSFTPAEIRGIVESVYAIVMDDDDYTLVSVQDPDEERTDIKPGVGVYMSDDEVETWGAFLPCRLVAEDTLGNWLVVTEHGRTVQFFGGGREVKGGPPTEVVRARGIARGGIDIIEDELTRIEESRPDIAREIKVGKTYVEGPRWALAYLADGLESTTRIDVEDFVGTNYFREMTDAMHEFGVRNALKSYKVAAKRLRSAKPVRRSK